MGKKYLLDTNAYFYMLKAAKIPEVHEEFKTQIETIGQGNIYISAITKVEIISVLGKYARGVSGGHQKCNCIISQDGTKCSHSRYVIPRKKWNNRKLKAWLKLIDDINSGQSDFIQIRILPFDNETLGCAQKIILHALINSFGSLDAMIAATAEREIEQKNEIIVVTSDKALIQCLQKCKIPYWDAFSRT